jgi:hypothetical protein
MAAGELSIINNNFCVSKNISMFTTITHLLNEHVAGRDGRAGDREVIWDGGMD